jgi:hypothetical protein
MSLATKVGLLAGATALTIGAGALAETMDYTALQARLDAAEAKINELETQKSSDWLTEQRSEEIRGLVQDVLADADTRASLQGSGVSAGYDGGFNLSNADGSVSMTINGVMQQRWVYLDNDTPGVDEEHGFETTRAELQFSGNAGAGVTYDMRTAWGANSANANMRWAYAGVDLGDDMTLTMGLQKVPFSHAGLVNAENQMGVERSWIANVMGSGANTAEGLTLHYAGDSMNFAVMYGEHGSNGSTGPYDGWANDSWMLAARVEFLGGGTFGQFDDYSSAPGSTEGMMVGVGIWWDNTGTNTDTTLTVDANWDFDGWNAGVAFYYEDDDGSTANPWAFDLHAGYYMDADSEIYGSLEWYDADDGSDEAKLLTVGWNNYLNGNTKWTIELGYTFDGLPALGASENNWLVTSADDQMMLRTQLQVSF